MLTTEHPPASQTLIHISDVHFTGDGSPLYGAVDSEGSFSAMLQGLVESGQKARALIFTGDLTDEGESPAYDRLRALVEPAAEKMGAEIIWVMGNHDKRPEFRERLLDRGRGTEPFDEVHDLDGLRVVVLDSTVPGYHYGELSEHQLAWLAGVLETPAPQGTIIAMHHPPVPGVQPLTQLVELRGQRAFAEVVRGKDVRAILAGHLHYSSFAMFAGVPVSVASATCYTQDLVGEVNDDGVRSTRGRDIHQSYNLVQIYEDTVVHAVVQQGGGRDVGEPVDADEVARRLADAGLVIREPGSASA